MLQTATSHVHGNDESITATATADNASNVDGTTTATKQDFIGITKQ